MFNIAKVLVSRRWGPFVGAETPNGQQIFISFFRPNEAVFRPLHTARERLITSAIFSSRPPP